MTPATGRILGSISIGAVVCAGAVWYVRSPGPLAFAGGSTVALPNYKGDNPTGVPASMAQASLVERGEYLARAADCMVCHTAPGAKEYAGGFAFKLPFGTLYSTNITPDNDTGIGKYTDQQFLDAVQRGKRHDGARLYPAMPYTSYSYMTDADTLAVKAYLFSLSPVRAPALENSLAFPFNQRWAMAFWSAVFNRDTRYEPDTTKSPEWNRGAYLVEALAHCGECHTPRNIGFSLDNHKKFGGALTAGWRAFNISDDKNAGLGDWSDDDVAAYLAVGHVKDRGTASGPMGEAVDHSFSKLAPEDIRAMVAFLRTVPPVLSPDLPATRAAVASASHGEGGDINNARGKMVFQGACAGCHGWSGVSPSLATATLTGTRAINDPKATNVAQVILGGGQRHAQDSSVYMPAFGSTYSDSEVASVANYVTARFGAEGSALSAKDIEKMRAAQ
jgi:mono/diheme cytochrome c family protein